MQTLKEKIIALSQEIYPQLISIRRHLHAHPELSFEEYETSKYIQYVLTQWNIPFTAGIVKTGVTVLIEGKNPSSKYIGLRADIDALPITEENDIEYKSKNIGVMHACGHDVHTTCLLGAIKILHTLRNEFDGTIKAIFQPGEEKNPGGASLMIKEGVLENPKLQAILGLHVHTTLNIGEFSFRGGKSMASADELYITLKAKGGHAAAPHLTPDPILAASHIVVALQQIISRNNDPFNPSVLSISSIQGGHTTNVIPNEVKLKGTFRAMNEEWRFAAHTLIKNTIEHIAQAHQVNADVLVDVGYPMVFNDEQLTQQAKQHAIDFIGEKNCSETELRMGAEDFGYYTQQIRGCFFRLGVKKPLQQSIPSVHTSLFNIDEEAIRLGAQMMAWLGIKIE